MQNVLTLVLVLVLGLPALQLPWVLQGLASGPLSADAPRGLWSMGGLAGGVLTCLVLRRSSRMRFLTTLLHEVAHLSMALVLGTSPRSLSAGEQAGLFQYELGGPVPKVRAFFITIAPYFVSPLLVAPVVLALLLGATEDWRSGFLAWLLGICLTLPLAEIHPRQPDLRRYGLVPPILAAVWLWGALAALTLALMASSSASASFGLYPESWKLVGRFLQ